MVASGQKWRAYPFIALGPLLSSAGCQILQPLAPLTDGWLSVSTVTSGGEFDPNGYLVSVGGSIGHIDLNSSGPLNQLLAGEYHVELTDVAPNCSAIGGSQRTATVAATRMTHVTFELTCTPRPELAAISLLFDRDGQIYTRSGDGVTEARLTDGALGIHNYDAAIAPNGERIALASNRDAPLIPDGEGGTYRNGWDIYVMNVDGTGIARVTVGGRSSDPAWSPDGSSIAYAGPGGIRVVRSDGTTDISLTNAPGDGAPAWSPDATRVAFTRWESIWVVNVDGSGASRLTDRYSDRPVWSADGASIVFTSYGRFWPGEDGEVFIQDQEVYIMSSDGSAQVQLTSGDSLGVDFHANAYSTDGQAIALSGARRVQDGRSWTSSSHIYVLNPATGFIARMTAGAGVYENSPSFLPSSWLGSHP